MALQPDGQTDRQTECVLLAATVKLSRTASEPLTTTSSSSSSRA